jgi:putative oxidoreductase
MLLQDGGDEMNSLASSDTPGPTQISVSILLLRIAATSAFLYHGSAILFGFFGGPGPEQFAAAHHWPVILGYLIGLAQVGGGLAIFSGVLIRVGAASIFVVMLGAIFLVHLPYGFNVATGGFEYALTQLFLATALVISGAGQYSLGRWLPLWFRKW